MGRNTPVLQIPYIIILCNLLKCDNQRDFLVLMSGFIVVIET